ncbi:MAG: hypothetical protein QG567_16 [Campylobacterota bacterium]|nr:hypothetical protein [Campylobacterota bacterium]MDQ1338867.1 hypothetical protein [Campylobacterota bacterium]
MRYLAGLIMVLILTGCGDKAQETHYNGAALLEKKCGICHNLKMPPDTYEDEKAPPMMAVVFHLKDFMKIKDNEDKAKKFIPFIQDYTLEPSREKSYCDEASLDAYGLMPSQKGNVTEDELKAIAEYIFTFYDQEKYLKEMQEKAAFYALPKGEQLVRKSGCLNCHDIQKAKVGPSFAMIANKGAEEIIDVIQNGSQGKWEGFHNMLMPAFKNKFTQDELRILQEWIHTLGTKDKASP